MRQPATRLTLLAVVLLILISTKAIVSDEIRKEIYEPIIPCSAAEVAHYTAYHTQDTIQIDGRLDEAAWKQAPRSTRYVDLVSGKRALYDTRAAVMWDDRNLYVGVWLEEPDVRGDLTERDSLIWQNNDAEVFIAGKDTYYEFEINSLGTILEVFYVWADAYEKGGYSKIPELSRDNDRVKDWNGVGLRNHPRGKRISSLAWDFPGLKSAVWIDGTLNNSQDRDRGWTVELALPWKGMELLARGDNRALPPGDGDTWRMDLSRFNQYQEAPPARDSGGWALSTHRVWDSHVPECFPYIHFSTRDVSSAVKKE